MAYTWSELEDLFQNAIKLPTNERENYVNKETAGNKQLKETILVMLRDVDDADAYFHNLQAGIASGFVEEKVDIFKIGDVLGKYTILKPLGSGGMGQVYLAERNDQQFDQKVAIKGFSEKDLKKGFFENFRNEQQFLANLSHGNIAHILDGGLTDEGIHYIIMEYVDGQPIDQYIRNQHQTAQEKLDIFLRICEVINYAHNRLILHLDIKPANILVNQDNQIKLLDFGIAQKVDEPLYQKTIHASPFYAAPEQLQQNPISVATDIYQLGIMLHIILSDELPFEKEEFPASEQRKLHLADHKINPELLAVIQKCLKESPDERYVSATAIIQDVESFIQNKPISVYSEKWSYITNKYFKRNKLKIALSVLLLISLISGVIIFSYQAEIARKSEMKAIKTNEFLLDIFKSANPIQSEGTLTVKGILDNSVENIEFKFEDRAFKLSLYNQLIKIYTSVFLWNDSKNLAEKVFSKYPEMENESTLNMMSTLAGNYRELSEFKKADSVFHLLLEKIERPNQKLSSNFKIENTLAFAKSQQIQGNYDSALFFINRARSYQSKSTNVKYSADIFNHYAAVFKDLSKFDSATYYQKKAIKLLEKQTDPETQNALAIYFNNQGNLFRDMSYYDSAIAAFEKSILLKGGISSKNDLGIAVTLSNLGGVYYKVKNYDSAIVVLNRAINIFQTQLEEDNNFIVSTRYSLANIYYSKQDYERALKEYESILAADISNFGAEHPYVADDYVALSNCQIALKQFDAAKDNLKKADKIIDAKFDKSHQKVSYIHHKYGSFYESQANYMMAHIYYQESYELAKAYLGDEHRNTKDYKKDFDRVSNIIKEKS